MRGPNLGRAALIGLMARAASFSASFFLVSSVYRSVGGGGYELYAVATTISGLLPFMDLGLGFGMVTRLTQVAATNNVEASRKVVSTSFTILSCLSALVLSFVLLASPLFSWGTLLGVHSQDADTAVLIVLTGIAASLTSGVGSRVLFALQKAHVGYGWDIASAVLVLLSSAVGPFIGAGALFYIAAVTWSPVLVGLLQTGWVLSRAHPELRPSRRSFCRTEIKPLMRLGGVYSYSGLAVALGVQGNLLVLSHLATSQDVVAYSLAVRLASIFFVFASVMLTPLWPAFGQAVATEDHPWIRKTLISASALVVSGTILFIIFMAVAGQTVVKIWVGDDGGVSKTLLAAVALATGVRVTLLPLNMLLNGAAINRLQVGATTAMIIVTLPITVALTPEIGALGPAVGTIVGTTVGLLVPYSIYVRKVYLRSDSTTPSLARSMSS